MASERPIVLPGDDISPENIPSHPKHALRLGPGLRHIPPSTLQPTVAGQLVADRRKNSLWVEHGGGRYTPSTNDLVIAQVHHSSTDVYYASLSPYTAHATLPHLAFEGATKKTRPQLLPGALVYARIALANIHMDPELECASPATGKADGLGPLVGGTCIAVSLGLARRLLMPAARRKAAEQEGGGGDGGVVVLEELGAAGLAFETAVGRNGKVWIGGESTKALVCVARALTETDDKALGVEAQKKLVRRLVKEMG